MNLNDDKIQQIEDLIDLAYEHCNNEEPIESHTSKAPKEIKTVKRKKYTKWQQAFVDSQIFTRKF
ncbi:hypothetical protein MJH12_02045 [bacterium]|nr:hypothetical protein [bacterium]